MNKSSKKVTFLLSLSAAFEYYDFVIYALMANYLGVLFFPSDDLFVAKLKAFSVFALGYIVRPLGALIFGMIGDLKGRKKIFVQNNIILSFATVIISILPNYQQAGIIATISLVVLRIIQSLAFSAELPGAMSLIKDIDNDKSSSFGFVISGAALGSVLASLVLFLLEANFSQQEIFDYAWRFPFILGFVLYLVGFFIRKNLPDIKEERAESKVGIVSDILQNYKNVISFVLIVSIPAYLIIMNLFFPAYLSKFYEYKPKDIYYAITCSMVWSIVISPVFSYIISYAKNKITVVRVVLFIVPIIGMVINFLFLRQGLQGLLIGLFLYQSIISILMILIFPLMAEFFPGKAKFTMIAVCYNVAYMFMSFSPSLISKLSEKLESPISLWLGLLALSFISLSNLANFESNQEK